MEKGKRHLGAASYGLGLIMSEQIRQPWDRTKWLLLIAILMLTEGIVFYTSMVHMKGHDAQGYVSFAGTVTSIVLAVLAIIYGFVQNSSQDRKSEMISQQMGRVREVVDELKKSKYDLGDEVDKFELISKKINDLLLKHDRTSLAVEAMQKQLNKYGQEDFAPQKTESNFYKETPVLLPVLYAIYYSIEHKSLNKYKEIQKFSSEMFMAFSDERPENDNQVYMYLAGQFSVVIRFLAFLEKLDIDGSGNIRLTPAFKNLLIESFENSKDEAFLEFKKVVALKNEQ